MKDQSNYLVIGGTGKTGRRVVERLNQMNKNVRIGSRSQTPSFNWNDQSNWSEVLKNIDKVYIVYHPDLAVPGAYESIVALTEAAKEAGVKKLVLLSGKGEVEAERCEEVVANCGLDYTLVRASWFNQNFSESFFLDPILAGHLALPMAEAKIPFVDADDIADMVVESLINDAHNGQTYEVTGPRFLTFGELAKEVSKATGRDIHFQAVTLEEYSKGMEAAGVPKDVIWLFNYLFTEVLGNEKNQEITHDVEKVLGRKAKDFSTFAQETAAAGIWTPEVMAI
ncbi:MAG: NmrA family NAD(P)-binding protein [Bacteroidota bacterium]